MSDNIQNSVCEDANYLNQNDQIANSELNKIKKSMNYHLSKNLSK